MYHLRRGLTTPFSLLFAEKIHGRSFTICVCVGVGRGVDGTETRYEAAGFLCEGGEYEVATYHYTSLALVTGSLQDAVSYALEKFPGERLTELRITKKNVVDLDIYFDGKKGSGQ